MKQIRISQVVQMMSLFITIAMLIFTTSAVAQSDDHKRPGGPPPEAIEACSGSSTGDECSFEGRRGSVTGICRTPPGESNLVCVPRQ